MNRIFKEVPSFTAKWHALGLSDDDCKGGIVISLYEDLEKGLLEAVEIEKKQVPLSQRPNMPAPTFYAENREKTLIDELVSIRKNQKISQSKLANLTGNKQQAISRLEKKGNSPSLKFYSVC